MLATILDLHRNYPILRYDAAPEAECAGLMAQKIRIGTMDLRIAAVARAYGLTVVTRNNSDFGKVPNLITVDWTR